MKSVAKEYASRGVTANTVAPGFITTDIRYTFKNSNEPGTEQMENLVSNGGMVNLTVGLRLK
jgi:NAD(P)-dependent dehydrogenase (short-subunit alcohol dehydrogenase family)